MTPSPLVGALERIRPHDHLCSIYERPEERLAVAVPFIRIGLERGEKCVYVGNDGGEEALRLALQGDGIDVERFVDTGALVLRDKEQAYLRRGRFEPEDMFAFWREEAAAAASAGFATMRGAGEADWVLQKTPGIERWLEYESKLTEVMLGCNCLVLCQYDRRLYPPETLLGVIRTHPLVIFDGAVCGNHYHVPPREFLRDNKTEHEVERLLGNIRDRERAEEEIREANARTELVLNSVSDHFFAFDKDWRFRYMNKHAAQQLVQLGKDPVQIIGKVMWDEFAEVPNEASIRRAMAERVPVVEELYYPPLGEWVENNWYPSADGGLVTYQRYITGSKRSEDALRRSEAQLAEGQKISHTGSWTWSARSGSLLWSLEHFRICGLSPERPPTYEGFFELVHPDEREKMRQKFEHAVAKGDDFEGEYRIVRPDGQVRDIQSLAKAVYDDSGTLIEYIGTVMDMTDRKRAEEDLRKAREDLARVNRALTVGELTASIAHELNQPLAAVVTNANACERWLAAQPPNIPEANDALHRISRDANRASDVIFRIRALLTKSATRRAELRVDEIIRDVATLVQGQAAAQNVTLLVEIAPHLPPLLADRVQIQQVILNLVLNALDSMAAVAGMRVLNLRAATHEGEELLISVRDSGVGLDPRHTEQVFDAFFTTKAEGMGMGLAISRSIVEAHDGRLWATRNDGPGATFQFTLPISPPR